MAVRLTPLIAVAIMAFSCNGEAPPSNLFVPKWTPEPGAPVATGELPGRLEERDGCLLWSNEKDFLALWPDDFEVDREELTIETASGVVVAIGEGGTLGGGERSLAQAQSLIGKEIPSRCRSAGGYWMVTEIIPD